MVFCTSWRNLPDGILALDDTGASANGVARNGHQPDGTLINLATTSTA